MVTAMKNFTADFLQRLEGLSLRVVVVFPSVDDPTEPDFGMKVIDTVTKKVLAYYLSESQETLNKVTTEFLLKEVAKREAAGTA